jgi:hypothetical protein
MSESNTDNKEVVKEAVVVSESNSDKVEKATKAKKATTEKKTATAKKAATEKKTTTAKKTTKAKTAKKVEEVVVAKSVSDEKVKAAPSVTNIKKEEKKEVVSSSFNYFSIAAGILLVVTLTVVTFFQDEYESAVASLMSITATEEVAEIEQAASQDLVADVSTGNAQVAGQMIQPGYANYAYQGMGQNQVRNNSFDEMVKKQQAAYDEAMRVRNERINEMHQLRTASFQRMDKNQSDRRAKMETMRIKTQQIQLEMQQKMQAAYNEFHAI